MERLSDLFTTCGALADTNDDGIADDIALRFVLPESLTGEEWCALADLAAVLGLHVTGVSPPLVVDAWGGLTLTVTHDATTAAHTGHVALERDVLTISGADGAAVAAMLRALTHGPIPDAGEWAVTAAQYPLAMPDTPALLETVAAFADPFMRAGSHLPGVFLDRNGDRLPDDTCITIAVPSVLAHEVGAMLVDCGARVGVETTGLTVPLFVPVPGADAKGIVAAMRHLAAPEAPEPFVPRVELRPKEVVRWSHEWHGARERDALFAAIEGLLPSVEDGPCSLAVQISEPAAIRAAVREELRASLPDGSDVTVLPVYHAGRAWLVEVVAPAANVLPGLASLEILCQPFRPEREPCLDLRIRWLQECWPADELIAPFLDLPIEAVQIALGPETQTDVYLARARDAAGSVIGQWAFSPAMYPRPYLVHVSAAPEETEWVHASVGGVTLRQGDRTRFHDTIPTDLDGFWDEWQRVVLPAVHDAILSLNGGAPTAAMQPFFDELRVEVWVSEPEYALGVREERESPAEGLAEDIYFNALDSIAALGMQREETWEEPGQIVPLVHIAPGEPPRARISLIRYESVERPAPVPVTPRTAGVAMDEVVTGENLPGLLAYLDTFAAVTVRGVGASFRGRPVAAVEVVKPDHATMRSRTKLAAIKPTHLIVARHHANEVASTTAALTLIAQLANDPAIMPLLDRVNVVVIPDENPDGTALHARLMQEHPTWKHHAARYNAVGAEFSRHFDDPETLYGEARVRPLLLHQWRPDLITDNHGVPTHEWWQPFAGGTSPPRFRISYWLCQALVYGICRYVPDDAHAAFAVALRDAVSAAVAAERDLAAANRVYAERYARWGRQYLPAAFPATYHDDMFWFFMAADAGAEKRPNDLSLREPQMVSAGWVTEVLDETAGGDHLALVAKAHLTANLAALRLTAMHAPPVTFSVEPLGNGRYRHRLHRVRPLRIATD